MGLHSSRDKRPFVGIRFLLKNELPSNYIKFFLFEVLEDKVKPILPSPRPFMWGMPLP
jgi:hypothetical protein